MMAKRKIAKKKKKLTDADVFKAFGVGPKEKSLRAFISGQRKINGRLYKAIDLIGEALKAERSGKGKRHDTSLDRALEINDAVPDELPELFHQGGGHVHRR